MSDIMRMGDEPKFLGSWDLYELPNKRITVTIRKIEEEYVDDTKGQKKKKAICYFKEDVKPMILNIENKKRLIKLFQTKDNNALIGKRIEICYEKVKAFGDIYDALRVVSRLINQEEPEIIVKCDLCGNDIKPLRKMSSEQVAQYTKEKYGKQLCSDCATVAAKNKEVSDDA